MKIVSITAATAFVAVASPIAAAPMQDTTTTGTPPVAQTTPAPAPAPAAPPAADPAAPAAPELTEKEKATLDKCKAMPYAHQMQSSKCTDIMKKAGVQPVEPEQPRQ